MLDGLFILLVLSAIMMTASFLAGALPLSMSLSSSQLRLLSSIGMGVLVGTALIVIIPEGIGAIYSPDISGHAHTSKQPTIGSRALAIRWRGEATISSHAGPVMIGRAPDDFDPSEIARRKDTGESVDQKDPKKTSKDASQAETAHTEGSPTSYIGLSLISGFVLMYLIDKLPRHASDNLTPPTAPRHISLNNLAQGLHSNGSIAGSDLDNEGFLQSLTPSPKQTRSLATTTGLVIHAFADGIAMGASASSADSKLGFIVFVAIMVHKAPAAFGLTSVLLKQGLSKRAARGHLIVFSLAAPFGSLSTWLLVNLMGGWHASSERNRLWWTGMLLLFSGGTFLYVAMHAMQDEPSSTHEHSSSSLSSTNSNGYVDVGAGGGFGLGGLGHAATRRPAKPQMRDTLAAVGGMLIPVLTQFGHEH